MELGIDNTGLFLLVCLGAYLVGSIPFAQIFTSIFSPGTRLKDIGTRNIGATNVTVKVGVVPGILTFLCDAFKGVAVTLLTRHIFDLSFATDLYPLLFVSIFVFIGHGFPVFLRFHGGKGLALLGGYLFFFGPVWCLLALCLNLLVMHRKDPEFKLAGLNLNMLLLFPVMSLFWIIENNISVGFLTWDFTWLFGDKVVSTTPLSWFALIWGAIFFIQRNLGNPGVVKDIRKGISPWKAIFLRGLFGVYPAESDFRHPDKDMPMGEELFYRNRHGMQEK